MYVRIFMGVVLAMALIGLACGGDGENGTGEGENGTAATETPAQQEETPVQEETGDEAAAGDDAAAADEADEEDGEDMAAPTVGAGSGAVTISDVTYEFDVEYCELGSEGTEIDIRGQGTGPDGRLLTVRATRSGGIDIIQVHISEGLTVFLSGTGTSDVLGGEAPSFEVDGRMVTTTATFYTPEEQEKGAEATGVEGSFVVNCP